MSDENVVEIRGLNKAYPNFSLKDLEMDVPKGTIVGLVGENGAGKSTLIYSMLDLVNKDSGEVTFWGRTLQEDKSLKEKIGVVFDTLNIYETFTPVMIEKVLSGTYRSWDSALYHRLLSDFNLDPKKSVSSLSKGMKVKLSIALALAHHPSLLIMDEVTDGLDPVMRENLIETLLDFIQDEEKAILISSHNMLDIERVADYITFLRDGEIVFTKSKDDLKYNYGIVRIEPERAKEIIDKDYTRCLRKIGYQVDVVVSDKERARQDFPDTVVDDATLDELMLILMKGEIL